MPRRERAPRRGDVDRLLARGCIGISLPAPALAEIASLFSGAPRFQVNQQRGAGHNISLGHTAAAYHSTVLSFANECMNTQNPSKQTGLEAG